jgi:hypothetical protein
MLVSGFHPAAVLDQIERAEGVKLDLSAIVAYAQTIEKVDVPALKDEFGGQDVVSDPLAKAHEALILLGSRIAKRLAVERLTPDEHDSRIDSLLLNYMKAAGDLAQLMNSVGVNPWEKRNKTNEHPTLTMEVTLRDMLNPTPPIDGEYKEL